MATKTGSASLRNVSAFRPAAVRHDSDFKRHTPSHIKALIPGGEWQGA